MRVLVTGATGFIGRRLLTMLVEHEVVCLTHDRPVDPSLPNVRSLRVDSDNWETETRKFSPEWCFHLAWQGLPDYSMKACRPNIDFGLALFDVLSRSRARRLVVAGTCWEYGSLTGPVSEAAHPGARGVFASSKHALHTVLEAQAREAGFEYRWARVFFTYGPGQRSSSLIPSMHAALVDGRAPALREPAAAQDFVHVDDVASGLVALAQADAPSGAFNLGSGKPTSVARVANLVAECVGARPPFVEPVATQGFWADQRYTESTTGWRAQIDIAAGVADTVATLGAVV